MVAAEEVHRRASDLHDRLDHGRQQRIGDPGIRQAVESHDGDVVGHTQPLLPKGPQRSTAIGSVATNKASGRSASMASVAR